MNASKSLLTEILTSLRQAHQLPSKIDYSKVEKRFWCVIADDLNADIEPAKLIISESVFTGMSFDKDTAVLKALSERAERQAFIDGAKSGLASCLTPRSDGFAALPKSLLLSMDVREFALNEAIERFAWATWWDNKNIGFELIDWQEFDFSKEKTKYIEKTLLSMNLDQVWVVKPKLKNSLDKQVMILIANRMLRAGFVSGGACGNKSETEDIFFRAFDELYRHGSAIQRANEEKLNPISFYEQRLLYFGSGLGDQLVIDRFLQKGTECIILPELAFDSQVPTKFLDFVVHRCYFQNQPPFVGGAVERFCL